MDRISLLLLLLGTVHAQQCCVWSNFDQVVSASGPPPQLAPDSSCSGPNYAWTACSSGCKTFACTRYRSYYTPLQIIETFNVAICDPSEATNAAAVKSKYIADNGRCDQSVGITRIVPGSLTTSAAYVATTTSAAYVATTSLAAYVATNTSAAYVVRPLTASTELPLTASIVTTAATAGSVGGSIAGTLIATLLTWFLTTFGDCILNFILGKVYSDFKRKVSAWIKARKDAADRRANPKVGKTANNASGGQGGDLEDCKHEQEMPDELLEIMSRLRNAIVHHLEARAPDSTHSSPQDVWAQSMASEHALSGDSAARSSYGSPEMTSTVLPAPH